MCEHNAKEKFPRVAERGNVPEQVRPAGFGDMVLNKCSDWQELGGGLLRSVRLDISTLEKDAKKTLLKKVVEFPNKADGTEMTNPQTAVGGSVILQKEGMKDAAE